MNSQSGRSPKPSQGGEPTPPAASAPSSRAEQRLPGSRLGHLLRSPLWLVLVLALVVRAVYLVEVVETPIWYWHLWDQSDMDTFLQGARRILAGDLLGRDPYHPHHLWHEAIAPAEQWRRWYAPHVFHQVPGYYYFLALLLKLSGGSLAAIKLTHSLLGAIHATLLGAIGQRIMGRTGGLIVGILAAIYGPFVGTEPMILREGLGALLATLGLYAVLRSLDRSPRDRARRGLLSWSATGAVFGIGALTKETGFVLFTAVWLWVLGRSFWEPRRPRRIAAFVLLAGFALGVSPLVTRNIVVGAPPLGFSPQGAVNFIFGNAADSESRGVSFLTLPPSFKAIMERSQGRLLPSIVATLQTYDRQPSLFLANLWAKFSAAWSNLEQPDNFNYEYLKMRSVLLQSLPRFVCVWLPAALGLMLLTARWISGRRPAPSAGRSASQERVTPTIPFPREILGLLLVILAAHAFAQSLLPVMSRYRLVIVPFLILPAGWILAQGLAWLAGRRWSAAAGTGVGLGALVVLWSLWPADPYLERAARRPADFVVGASILMRRNDVAGAREEFERGIAYIRSHGASIQDPQPGELLLRRSRLLLFASYNRFDEVQEDWKILRQALPQDPAIQNFRGGLPQREGRTTPEPERVPGGPGERRGGSG